MALRLRGRGAVGGADPGEFTARYGGHGDSRLLHPEGRHRDDDPGVGQPRRGCLSKMARTTTGCASPILIRPLATARIIARARTWRTVGVILLPMLFERFPNMTLPDPASVRWHGFGFRGPLNLPLLLQ